MITAEPDIETLTLTDSDEFVLLACDGVWDVMDNQQAVDFIRKRLRGLGSGTLSARATLEALLDSCVSSDPRTACRPGIGCDNMTAVLVELPPPRGCASALRQLAVRTLPRG